MTKTFIIAEAGVNHNGSLKLALQLCDIAYKSGANAIKFQTFKSEQLVSNSSDLILFQDGIIQKS